VRPFLPHGMGKRDFLAREGVEQVKRA